MDSRLFNNKKFNWIKIISLLLVIMEVNSMVMATVALPSIEKYFNIETYKIIWVINVYMIASAIVMPMTGFLVSFFGTKSLLLICALGFTLTSMGCGLSKDLNQLLLVRGIQGIFGGVFVPISQALLRNEASQLSLIQSMSIWNLGLMIGPILGAILGGLLNDKIGWQWVFYANVPFGILGMLIGMFLPKNNAKAVQEFDFIALILAIISFGSLQLVFYLWQKSSFLYSDSIVILSLLSLLSSYFLLLRSHSIKISVLNLTILKDFNFLTCCLLYTLYSAITFSILAIQPVLLQKYMNYTAFDSSIILACRSLACLLVILMIPILHRNLNYRKLIIGGVICSAIANLLMANSDTLDTVYLVLSAMIQGIGIALFLTPLSAQAFNALHKRNSYDASGIYSYSRALGVSIALSFVTITISNFKMGNHNEEIFIYLRHYEIIFFILLLFIPVIYFLRAEQNIKVD